MMSNTKVSGPEEELKAVGYKARAIFRILLHGHMAIGHPHHMINYWNEFMNELLGWRES